MATTKRACFLLRPHTWRTVNWANNKQTELLCVCGATSSSRGKLRTLIIWLSNSGQMCEKFSDSRLNQPCNEVFSLCFIINETGECRRKGPSASNPHLILGLSSDYPSTHLSYSLSHTQSKLPSQEPMAQKKGSPNLPTTVTMRANSLHATHNAKVRCTPYSE